MFSGQIEHENSTCYFDSTVTIACFTLGLLNRNKNIYKFHLVYFAKKGLQKSIWLLSNLTTETGNEFYDTLYIAKACKFLAENKNGKQDDASLDLRKRLVFRSQFASVTWFSNTMDLFE